MNEIRLDPKTWKGQVFLTFDVDFASDDVLLEAVELVAKAGVPATWLATHATPVLDVIRANPLFELGIHPDFEGCLWGDEEGDAEDVLRRMREIVPDSTTVRSHCLTQSSPMSAMLHGYGFEVESNVFIPFDTGLALRPWRHFAGHIVAPFGWLDDVAAGAKTKTLAVEHARRAAMNIFIFHPIHVVANTASPQQLERAISVLRSPLADVRTAFARSRKPRGCHGSRDHLMSLLACARPAK